MSAATLPHPRTNRARTFGAARRAHRGACCCLPGTEADRDRRLRVAGGPERAPARRRLRGGPPRAGPLAAARPRRGNGGGRPTDGRGGDRGRRRRPRRPRIRLLRNPKIADAVRARCSDDTVVYVQRGGLDASDVLDPIAGPIRERLKIGITGRISDGRARRRCRRERGPRAGDHDRRRRPRPG